MATCAVYLIDPFSKTVTEVGYDGQLQTIYDLTQCSTFEVVGIDPTPDAIFVDGEGLFKEEQAFFMMPGWPQPLAGRGLWTGTDLEGETVAPVATIADITSKIMWLSLDEVRSKARAGAFG